MKHPLHPTPPGIHPLKSEFRAITLKQLFNNFGSTRQSDKDKGSINIWGNSLPREDLPPFGDLSYATGIPFLLDEDETGRDNVVCLGQRIIFPSCNVRRAHFIGLSERRNRDQFGFGIGDQPAKPLKIGFSDFWPEARSSFGNALFAQCSCLHYPRHIQPNMEPSVWRIQSEAVNTRADYITLPDNPAIHIFSLTLEVEGDDIPN